MKKVIYAIFNEWKFFTFILVLLYGFYLIDLSINKNMNELIREIPFSFSDARIAEELSSVNSELNNIASSFYDFKEELKFIAAELNDISSQINMLGLTRGRR